MRLNTLRMPAIRRHTVIVTDTVIRVLIYCSALCDYYSSQPRSSSIRIMVSCHIQARKDCVHIMDAYFLTHTQTLMRLLLSCPSHSTGSLREFVVDGVDSSAEYLQGTRTRKEECLGYWITSLQPWRTCAPCCRMMLSSSGLTMVRARRARNKGKKFPSQ
jgi:hypothetical protein